MKDFFSMKAEEAEENRKGLRSIALFKTFSQYISNKTTYPSFGKALKTHERSFIMYILDVKHQKNKKKNQKFIIFLVSSAFSHRLFNIQNLQRVLIELL